MGAPTALAGVGSGLGLAVGLEAIAFHALVGAAFVLNLARDRQGTLYRFNGNCHGVFAARVTIGGGWAKWQAMF